jgi:hypothetical protein
MLLSKCVLVEIHSYHVRMGVEHQSPLHHGKPRFMTKFVRRLLLYHAGNLVLFGGFFLLSSSLWDPISIFYSIVCLLYVFGVQVIFARWLHSHGATFWRFNRLLENSDQVPCPSCLYPLCPARDSAREHLCAECGCKISGDEAVRAWGRVRGMKVPTWMYRQIEDKSETASPRHSD